MPGSTVKACGSTVKACGSTVKACVFEQFCASEMAAGLYAPPPGELRWLMNEQIL